MQACKLWTAVPWFVIIAVTDMKNFTRGDMFSRILVHKKDFGLKWQALFKFDTHFVERNRILLLNLNEFGKKLQTSID